MTDYYESSDITRVVRIAHGTNRGLFFGFGAIVKFGEILDDLKPSCVGFVSSPTAYQKCGLWDTITKALAERGIEYLHYNGISTNPTVEQIDEAVDLFRAKYGPGFLVCGIGADPHAILRRRCLFFLSTLITKLESFIRVSSSLSAAQACSGQPNSRNWDGV